MASRYGSESPICSLPLEGPAELLSLTPSGLRLLLSGSREEQQQHQQRQQQQIGVDSSRRRSASSDSAAGVGSFRGMRRALVSEKVSFCLFGLVWQATYKLICLSSLNSRLYVQRKVGV